LEEITSPTLVNEIKVPETNFKPVQEPFVNADISIEALLNCTDSDIENSVFFANNLQLLNLVDNSIRAIDNRLMRKKAQISRMPIAV